MSRIGGVIGESETDSQLSVGKQLELESTNSIKYRTCSWQKVIHSISYAIELQLQGRKQDKLDASELYPISRVCWGAKSGHVLTDYGRPQRYSFRSTSVWL